MSTTKQGYRVSLVDHHGNAYYLTGSGWSGDASEANSYASIESARGDGRDSLRSKGERESIHIENHQGVLVEMVKS